MSRTQMEIDDQGKTEPLKDLLIEPIDLTVKQRYDVNAVKDAFGTFWDNIKFRKGWEKPLFTKEEVEPLLEEAAEVVVRVRHALDTLKPGFKLRMLDGSAKEFLWQFTKDPNKHRSSFIRGLVHAALSDANGYVEGLTREIIDEGIDTCRDLRGSVKDIQDPDLLDVLKSKFESLKDVGTSFLSANNDFLATSSEASNELRRLLGQVEGARLTLQRLGSLREKALLLEREQSEKKKSEEDEEVVEASEPQSPSQEPSDAQDSSPMDIEVGDPEPESNSDDTEVNPLPNLRKSNSVLLKINKIESDVDALKKDIAQLAKDAEALNPETITQDLPLGQKTVEALNKKAMRYSEELMKELLTLDEVIVAPEDRPRRKAQVNAINSLLEGVDEIRAKIKACRDEVMKAQKQEDAKRALEEAEAIAKKEKEEAEAKAKALAAALARKEAEAQRRRESAQRSPQPSPSRSEEESEADKMDTAPSEVETKEEVKEEESIWRQLKFEPEFDVQETRDSYIIKAFVPGMSPDDITVDLKDRDLVLEGYREPSPEEVTIMKKKIAAHRRQDPRGLHIPRGDSEQNLLLRLGAGKFGQFRQVYQLPDDADAAGIKARYDRGMFYLTIPKLRRPTYAAQPRARQPQRDPRGGYGGFPGFFNDGGYFW